MKKATYLLMGITIIVTLFFILKVDANQQNRGQGVKGQGVSSTENKQEKRVALVIGNSAYEIGALANPANDAKDLATTLRKLGFDVTEIINKPRKEMELSIREFGNKIKNGGVGLFYFAGHGVQIKDRNYLIPIGANIEKEEDVEFEGVDVGRVLGEMNAAQNRLNIVILDACRNNPFARSFRSSNSGLAQIKAPSGTIISYATAPGEVASDGTGKNGLYTQEFLKYIQEPGLEIGIVFRRVRESVEQKSGNKQTPWENSSIKGEFYFVTASNNGNSNDVTIDTSAKEQKYWDFVDKTNIGELKAYISKYPKGEYLELAKEKIKKLEIGNSLETANNPSINTSAGNSTLNLGRFISQKTVSPQLNIKLLFSVGSAYDPPGKEGLSGLAAAMITQAGSREKSIDEIEEAFFPIAGSFDSQVDKEMTTFTGVVHKDNLETFLNIALKQLFDPGFQENDFNRLKDQQLNALKENLRSNNDEELGKERLQHNIFAGTPYGHPVLGTVSGLQSITLDDVKNFIRNFYTRSNLMVGFSGDVPEEFTNRLKKELSVLSAGPTPELARKVIGRMPQGIEVEIIEKDTVATAISFGFPIEVNRSHPDFAALWLARAWLGEHRSSVSHLYHRIREIRGLNYGDYAYIEAFPRGMFQFFPDPNIARRAQIFEIWIRPVIPSNAHFALRIAISELDKLVEKGLTEKEFESIREYLMKNAFVMTATQNQQLGYALDSQWYKMEEFTSYIREKLQTLTLNEVNRVIKKHLNAKNLSVVMVTKDTKGLRQQLLEDGFSAIGYDAPKPQELLDEDKVIGTRKLNIRPEAIRITKLEDVFSK